jgi:hypothetical protein
LANLRSVSDWLLSVDFDYSPATLVQPIVRWDGVNPIEESGDEGHPIRTLGWAASRFLPFSHVFGRAVKWFFGLCHAVLALLLGVLGC